MRQWAGAERYVPTSAVHPALCMAEKNNRRFRHKWLAPLEPSAKESGTAQCPLHGHPAGLNDRSQAPDTSGKASNNENKQSK